MVRLAMKHARKSLRNATNRSNACFLECIVSDADLKKNLLKEGKKRTEEERRMEGEKEIGANKKEDPLPSNRWRTWPLRDSRTYTTHKSRATVSSRATTE